MVGGGEEGGGGVYEGGFCSGRRITRREKKVGGDDDASVSWGFFLGVIFFLISWDYFFQSCLDCSFFYDYVI